MTPAIPYPRDSLLFLTDGSNKSALKKMYPWYFEIGNLWASYEENGQKWKPVIAQNGYININASLNTLLKSHALANKWKLFMSFDAFILVFNRLTHLCINSYLDKCSRFGSCQTKRSCYKTLLGNDPTFCSCGFPTNWTPKRVFFLNDWWFSFLDCCDCDNLNASYFGGNVEANYDSTNSHEVCIWWLLENLLGLFVCEGSERFSLLTIPLQWICRDRALFPAMTWIFLWNDLNK